MASRVAGSDVLSRSAGPRGWRSFRSILPHAIDRPPQRGLLLLRHRGRAGRLRLDEGPQHQALILTSANRAERHGVESVFPPVGQKHLGVPLPAALAARRPAHRFSQSRLTNWIWPV